MNLPIPNVKEMTSEQFIMWLAAIVLGYILLINPMSLSGKIDQMSTLQAQMVSEHKDLLLGIQAQCINHADNVQDKDKRARHLLRCLTRDVKDLGVQP